MIGTARGRRGTVAEEHEAQDVVAVIDRVASLCRLALPDAAVEYELRELEVLKSALHEHWPLSSLVKECMALGPFAAKNISDWDLELADTLMRLDYSLRHDGEALGAVLPGSVTSEDGVLVPAEADRRAVRRVKTEARRA
jgi:hypothetical protein